MRCRIAIFTATVVLGSSCPVWSQDAPKDSTSVDTADEDLKIQYLIKAKERVDSVVDVFEKEAKRLAEYETAITNAENVISQAIVVWDALQKNVLTESNEIKKNLIAPQPVKGEPTHSARDTLVKALVDAIAQLKNEKKPYRLSAEETSSLEQPDKLLPVQSVADDADRLRWLEQQLMVAEQIMKGAVPSVPANANERRAESLAFIKKQLGVDKMVEIDQQPILDALKTLQPAEPKK